MARAQTEKTSKCAETNNVDGIATVEKVYACKPLGCNVLMFMTDAAPEMAKNMTCMCLWGIHVANSSQTRQSHKTVIMLYGAPAPENTSALQLHS